MQGLTGLYRYQGRRAEWARLVEEIRPDYCTDDDQPIPGREDNYSAVIRYCVEIAEDERDVARATTLLQKVAAFARQQAASVLDLPVDASLSDVQRNKLRTLSVAVFDTGRLLHQQLDGACLEHYQEALSLHERIGDKIGQAATEFNIGTAYLTRSRPFETSTLPKRPTSVAYI